jgi:hypothetical protein
VTVAEEGDTGLSSSLVIVDGRPAISFYDNGKGDLCFVRAIDSDGDSWAEVQVLDQLGDTGQQPAMALVNGRAAIAYHDAGHGALCYIAASDATAHHWLPRQLLHSQPFTGSGKLASLADNSGDPVIACMDTVETRLLYFWGR